MTTELLRTPLHDWHVAHGGRMVDFAGWSMPVQYSSIVDEHQATRKAVGIFDISHMGRLAFAGPNVGQFLDSIVTRRVVDLKPSQIRYGLVCNEQGGILDDVLVYNGTADGKLPHTMVVNASNREKIVAWLNRHAQGTGVSIKDNTISTTMIAVQGPKAIGIAQEIVKTEKPIESLRYYTYTTGEYQGSSVLVSRTGYTGEDGVEIICPAKLGTELWETIVQSAAKIGGMAAGLAARDTLRLEAAMPLYGHELSESLNPLQAALNFAVNLGGRKFIGSDALENYAVDKSQSVRVGLQLDGKRVPREGSQVLQDGNIVGEVTSGTFSPTFERPIAMAYVRPEAAVVGTQLATDIRGTQYPATVVALPFYERAKK